MAPDTLRRGFIFSHMNVHRALPDIDRVGQTRNYNGAASLGIGLTPVHLGRTNSLLPFISCDEEKEM